MDLYLKVNLVEFTIKYHRNNNNTALVVTFSITWFYCLIFDAHLTVAPIHETGLNANRTKCQYDAL